ncbi:glycoside hydrolase family 6 protein [Aeromicrobium wangtongii]|uniref:Glucanase n=1 Tax=Aeromicrobium wangtongii TaxID=2969247 RepID=A0ABY5M495_9ACTN|nr:glycoside hydrolase family 6 protein [Aeromicrobium wangtongii]MCD9198970.1 glycoside hydrolase family 6 protein [Aeromicrobium wangtongii]UUP12994.1 glycoside hydrolase family 6 protein [Aeromicrobium wangtongii]
MRRGGALAAFALAVAAVLVTAVLIGRDGGDGASAGNGRAEATDDAPAAVQIERPPIDLGKGLLRVPNETAAWLDRQGRKADPAVRKRIGAQPDAFWLVGDPKPDRLLGRLIKLARTKDRTLQLVLYNIPERNDPAGGGGASDAAAYAKWVEKISADLGDTRAIVVIEPDALRFTDRLAPKDPARAERMDSLRLAVATLVERNPRARVYVDAGTASGPGSVVPARMAELLTDVGVSDSVGFAVNVAGYSPDPEATAYARKIRNALIDRHGLSDPRYVVDTGRNGNPVWDYERCNPPGRLLGRPPELVEDPDGLDLLLWIKPPATSDGDCGIAPGSRGGEFLPDEAIRMSHDRP